MTEKCCLSAGGKKKGRGGRRTETKAVDSGEQQKDKVKNGVKQKLNEIEGMTEIRRRLTEEEASGNGGREMTSDRKRGGMRGGGEEEDEKGREGKGG